MFRRYKKGVLFVNGRYTKGVSFPPKMVYKRVRGWTSGRSLPVLNFFSTPRGFIRDLFSTLCLSVLGCARPWLTLCLSVAYAVPVRGLRCA